MIVTRNSYYASAAVSCSHSFQGRELDIGRAQTLAVRWQEVLAKKKEGCVSEGARTVPNWQGAGLGDVATVKGTGLATESASGVKAPTGCPLRLAHDTRTSLLIIGPVFHKF
jgi:hypothetical protein